MEIVDLREQWTYGLRFDAFALCFAYRNPITPWLADIWTAIVVACAFSEIDLIPDLISIIG